MAARLPACLPRLSGALPDRTLNPARLNLGIIYGYKPGNRASPLPDPRKFPLVFLAIFCSPLAIRYAREGPALPLPPPLPLAREHFTGAVELLLSLDLDLHVQLLLRTHCANIFAGEQHARRAAIQMFARPFLRASQLGRMMIERLENLERANLLTVCSIE